MRRRVLAILSAAVLGVAGCGGGSATPSLADGTARQLQADVLAVTQGAAGHNLSAARTALQKLRTDPAAARSAGTVTAARAAAIEVAAAAVSSDLSAAATANTPTPTTTTSATRTGAPSTPPHPPKPAKTKKRGHGG